VARADEGPMRGFRFRVVGCLIGLVVLAACTPELPKFAREHQLPPSVKSAAIPLERALKEGMVEATPLATHSTRTEMAILLKPLVTSQPWIRIDPGWVAANKQFSQVSFVVCHTVYARLPQRKNYTIRVRHARLKCTRSTGMPSDSRLEQVDDERLVSFLETTDDGDKDPDWKILQIAVWALTDDISYTERTVKPPTSGDHIGFKGNHQYATAGQIGEVMELLASAGHDREDFNLWKTINEQLDHEVVAYENHWDNDAAKAFVSFKKICNFYPLEVAADIMFSAFDRHEGVKGRDFRFEVVNILGRHGGDREIKLLRERSSFEADQKILKTMHTIIDGYAAPGR
jgi:hypothetical protein